jgi:DNA topoisomerase-1
VDLPPGRLGINVDREFNYDIEPIKKKIDYLKKNLMDADEIYLAMDPDREGEAIAADILENCVLAGSKVQRIVFNAIVFRAVREALENPRQIAKHGLVYLPQIAGSADYPPPADCDCYGSLP